MMIFFLLRTMICPLRGVVILRPERSKRSSAVETALAVSLGVVCTPYGTNTFFLLCFCLSDSWYSRFFKDGIGHTHGIRHESQ